MEVWFASAPWEGMVFTWVCNVITLLFQMEDWHSSKALYSFVLQVTKPSFTGHGDFQVVNEILFMGKPYSNELEVVTSMYR